MPSELFVRINLDQLYPPFLLKLLEAVAAAKAAGFTYVATSGHRSPAEQLKLWNQGRTTPGPVVTKVQFGLHNVGLAVDFVKDGSAAAGLQPVWDSAAYKPLADAAKAQGLEAGYYWKSFQDAPHVQLPIAKHGITIAKLKALHDQGGIPAVWKYLDQFQW